MTLPTVKEQSEKRMKLKELLREKDAVGLLKEKLKILEEKLERCVSKDGCVKKEHQEKWGIVVDNIGALKKVVELMKFENNKI